MDDTRKSSAKTHGLSSKLKRAYRKRGPWRFPFSASRTMVKHGLLHLRRAFLSVFAPPPFSFDGGEYAYFFHVYRKTWRNERAVEVPLIRRYVQEQASGRVLEVGNVLSHYFPVRHDILDLHERAPGVVNEDVVSHRPDRPYDLIVSISTLEHVGWDEEPKNEAKVERAIAHLKSLLAPGGCLRVTVPLGYNLHLDRLIREGRTGFDRMHFLKRIAKRRWIETGWEEVRDSRYGAPYKAANGLAVGFADNPSRERGG